MSKQKLAQPKLTPADVKCEADVLSLDRSYFESGIRYSLLVNHDGSVYISDHVPGQESTGSVTIPRRNFQRLIEFYQTGK